MKTRNVLIGTVLGIGLFASGMIAAQDINAHRHPNLAAAQRLIDNAIGKIDAAQVANEYDMNGHAARAKDLLVQANGELKAAAEAANRH